MHLFQPSQFFTMGTVGKDRMHVTFNGIHDDAVCVIENLVGAVESSCLNA
ncbi:hypothetical protein SDC9_195940 [bioreactor metagenome]|uniref:Uncharacterized protein n=1 Tax=bioreactor metagenome TaxID=1076179 RepID=A0A645ILY4_9ZZZZ